MMSASSRGRRSLGGCVLRTLGCAGQTLVFLIIMAAFYYGSYLFLRGPLPHQVEIIAHRGASAHAPENTLAAFRRAVDAGAGWLEMDVQMSADGALVVIHDATVDRTTNGVGRVADLTLADLQALDAGDGEIIPTFQQVIQLAQEAGVNIMPEAKSPELYPGLEAAMVKAIQAAGYTDRTVIQSFSPAALDRLRALDPSQRLCALYGLGRFDLDGPYPGDAEAVCPMAEMVLLYPWMIRQAHDQGRLVYVWFGVVERPFTMRALVELGADGLMVDDPEALGEVLRQR
ncbi:MAG: hypothetical protein D6790_05070 [Caldilineae bacterium]|nr:MAG: hypothetical protein D6790_05070 [Caldilineae bacterium]